ncbi:hypothetical protein ACHAXM_004846 [Skeletonema potamos]
MSAFIFILSPHYFAELRSVLNNIRRRQTYYHITITMLQYLCHHRSSYFQQMNKISTMMHDIVVAPPLTYQQNSRIATFVSHSLNSSSLMCQNHSKSDQSSSSSRMYDHQTNNDSQLVIRRQLHNSTIRSMAATANEVHVTLFENASSDKNKSTPTNKPDNNSTGSSSSSNNICSQGITLETEEEEEEQEEMFVTADPVLGHGTIQEWGGPRRGGSLAEPTRFGDWERKGRCTDF